jgi:hypothetical protein
MNRIQITTRVMALCAVLAATTFANAAPEPSPSFAFPDRSPQRYADIANFIARDFQHWRQGYWMRDDRQLGHDWWWIVGDMWYPYERVSYPYPDPFTPPGRSQPAIIGRTFTAGPNGPSPPYYWFYCEAHDTYYPYVAVCESGWKPVRAQTTATR